MAPEKLQLRKAGIDDAEAIVRLNERSVAVTSPMSHEQCRELLAMSDFSLIVEYAGEVAGFLLAMTEGKNYNNGNYQWFGQRLRNFIYIDRIVIDENIRGAGLGKSLYAKLFNCARDSQLKLIAAEIDIQPANPSSLAFHDRHGFVELATRVLDNGKVVSMRVCSVDAQAS